MTLPGAVRDLALRLGASPARIAGPVHLTQTGNMKLRLDTEGWLPFRASQTLEVTRCAFSWRARFWPMGYLTVLDALVDGEGRMDVTAFGVFPLVRSRSSAALTKGELQRYLAELPYAPDAILHNPALEWREIDRNRVAVATGSGVQRAEVIFTLDPDGHIGSVRAEDRPRSATAPTLPTPWEGQFSDYRLCQGRSVPYSAEVSWVIDGKRNLYWHGSLTDWMLMPPVSSVTTTRPRRLSETLRDRTPAVGTASPRLKVTKTILASAEIPLPMWEARPSGASRAGGVTPEPNGIGVPALTGHAQSKRAMEARMEIRSTRTTLTFRKPFTLPLSDRTMPPGDYVLLTEEERLEGLTFNAYRRVAGYLIVSGGPEFPGRTEMIPVNDAEVAELVACDLQPGASGPELARLAGPSTT